MYRLDKSEIDTILIECEEDGDLFPAFKLNKVDGVPVLLGSGSTSYVYDMVSCEGVERHYALKVIFGENVEDKISDIKFLLGIQYGLRERNEYVVRILDAMTLSTNLNERNQYMQEGTRTTFIFILMDAYESVIYENRYKHAVLREGILQDVDDILKMAKQVGSAIALAHENNILHRDIKLENIFWDPYEKNYKLGDFGIAKYTDDGNAETVLYSDGYGAPEIINKSAEYYNATVDIYSFGVTLYLLLNDLKFPSSSGYYCNEIQYSLDYIFPAPVKGTPQLNRIIRKMVSFRSADRYQSMDEVLLALDSINVSMDEAGANDAEEYVEDIETEIYIDEPEVEEYEFIEENYDRADRYVDKSLDRQIDRELEIEERREYTLWTTGFFLIITILFTGILCGPQTDIAYISNWRFYLFPIVAVLCVWCDYVREFSILRLFFEYGVIIYCVYTLGFNLGTGIIIFSLLHYLRPMVLASVTSVLGWGVLQHYGYTEKISFVNNPVIICILWCLVFIVVRLFADKRFMMDVKDFKEDLYFAYVDNVHRWCIIIGTILLVISVLHIWSVPVELKNMQLLIIGIVLFLLNRFQFITKNKSGMEDYE